MRAVAGASAVIQLGAVVVLLVLRITSDGAVGDQLGVVPITVIYGMPAALALLAMRGRGPLLLAAGIASLLLAVFPFSLHSFVFGPVGVIYLLAYGRSSSSGEHGRRPGIAAVLVPFLLLGAFVVLLLHEDPVCYTKDASGQVTLDRDPQQVMSGSQTIEADSDVVERGCSSDTVVWWEAAASLGLSAAAGAAALWLAGPATKRTGVDSRSV